MTVDLRETSHGDRSDVDRVLRLQTCRSGRISIFALDADVCVSRAASPQGERRPNESHLLSGVLQTASQSVVAHPKGCSKADDASRGVVGVVAEIPPPHIL